MKNTLSKIAAGVGVLTLAVSLTACGGGGKLTTDEATCKEYRTQAEKIAGGNFADLNSDISNDKLKELYAKMVEIGNKSEAPVGKSFVTLGNVGPQMIAVTEKLKANPQDTDALAEMEKIGTGDVQSASGNVTSTCSSFWK